MDKRDNNRSDQNMKYCTNCGAKLAEGMRFCSNCGKPCLNQRSNTPSRISRNPQQQRSSGIWKFFAGTAIGAFLVHLFGGASASATSNHSTTEQSHETIVYGHEEDDDCDYDNHDNSYDDWERDDFNCGDYENDTMWCRWPMP